jgi:chemotaxis protein methyltransferase CheR
MTSNEFDCLRKVVYDRAGIHFQDSKKYVMESRLSRRLEELEMSTFSQYISFLTMGPYQSDEFQEMFNRITINETSFFRNQPQLDVFEKCVLPKLLEARKSSKRIRLWSAACSTGEEPYTLAMMLHRTLGLRLPDWRIEILGTDISERCLHAAQKGSYTSFSFRSVDPLVQQRYFKQEGNLFNLNDDIKQMVNFELHNLRDTLAAKRHGTWDVIFCRNVMIYFDEEMKKNCVKMFHNQLALDGTLFIGHSENLRDLGVPFHQMPVPQSFAYTKESVEGSK